MKIHNTAKLDHSANIQSDLRYRVDGAVTGKNKNNKKKKE